MAGGYEGYQGFPSTLIPNTFNSQMAGDTCDALSPQAFVQANPRAAGQATLTLGGSKTTGNVITLTIANGALPNGSLTLSYTVLSGDTLSSIAEKLAALINNNGTLQQYDIFATTYQGVLTFNQLGPVSSFTTLSYTLSGGATETITLSNAKSATVTVGGSETDGDTVVLRFTNANFSGGHEDVSYLTQTGDDLAAIAAALEAAVNADAVLKAAGISATYPGSGAVFTVLQSGPLFASLSDASAGATETLTAKTLTSQPTGGSGPAVPLQNTPVQIGASVINLRYFYPVLIPYVTLKTLVNQGTLIK